MGRLCAAPRSLSQPCRPCLSALVSFCGGRTKLGVKATRLFCYSIVEAEVDPTGWDSSSRHHGSKQALLAPGAAGVWGNRVYEHDTTPGIWELDDTMFFFFPFGIDIAAGDTT